MKSMFEKIFSAGILFALSCVKGSKLNEIRIRADYPIVLLVGGKSCYLGEQGITYDEDQALKVSKKELEDIVIRAADYSLYAINDQLIRGYISLEGGVRIGICGEVVTENNKIKTVKNITSINIRIPHSIKNCSLPIYPSLVKHGCIENTLVISSPGCGKTTFIRDLASQISLHTPFVNLLICDERCEITGMSEGQAHIKLGGNCDIITNCSKKYAFENGIRSMKPDVIVTDEINLDDDVEAIKNALTSGVKVVATIHAKDIHDLKKKDKFQEVVRDKLFSRYVVLSNRNGVGTCDGVFNENLACIYVS